jgi:hypothetical protein
MLEGVKITQSAMELAKNIRIEIADCPGEGAILFREHAGQGPFRTADDPCAKDETY